MKGLAVGGLGYHGTHAPVGFQSTSPQPGSANQSASSLSEPALMPCASSLPLLHVPALQGDNARDPARTHTRGVTESSCCSGLPGGGDAELTWLLATSPPTFSRQIGMLRFPLDFLDTSARTHWGVARGRNRDPACRNHPLPWRGDHCSLGAAGRHCESRVPSCTSE